MKKIKTIILANPTSDADRLFYSTNKEYLFPQVIKLLEGTGSISNPVISTSHTIKNQYSDIISSWGIPHISSEHILPQHRLAEISNADNSDGYLLLTPYSYLINSEHLFRALSYFQNNNVHCINYKGDSSASSFSICDKASIEYLAQIDSPVTPFTVAEHLINAEVQHHIYEANYDSSPARALLYSLLYKGGRGLLPRSLIIRYFADTPTESFFTTSSYNSLLANYFRIKNFNRFLETTTSLVQDFNLVTLAAQINFIKSILPFLPKQRDCFMELGFGATPIASLLLTNLFHTGHAIEPFAMESSGCEFIEFLSKNISIPDYINMEATKDCRRALKRLSIHTSQIEECNIPVNSVDFAFSRTVFEHVKDVLGVSQSLYRLLTPGGIMYHLVDFRDHIDTNTVRFDFLKYDRKTWAAMKRSTNLWRINDLVETWREIGFEVKIIEQRSRVPTTRDIHPCWDKYNSNDLFCYHGVIVAQKPM